MSFDFYLFFPDFFDFFVFLFLAEYLGLADYFLLIFFGEYLTDFFALILILFGDYFKDELFYNILLISLLISFPFSV